MLLLWTYSSFEHVCVLAVQKYPNPTILLYFKLPFELKGITSNFDFSFSRTVVMETYPLVY